MDNNLVVIDTAGLMPDMAYNRCLKQCEDLGLIEIIEHGDKDYGRITQKGINVLCTLLQLANNAAQPENRLKQS